MDGITSVTQLRAWELKARADETPQPVVLLTRVG